MTAMTMVRAPAYHDVLNPSHLSYKARAQLAEDDKFSYNTLWRKAYIPNVWDRMLADASARHEARLNASSYTEGANASYNPHALSGFTTNSQVPVYTHTSFKPYHNPELAPEPIGITHPRIAKRNALKNQIDYMCTIRPDVETMNQTLRPLGTYASDVPHAQRTGIHIPHMVLGPENMYWHPDVRLSERSWATATQVQDSLRAPDMFKASGQRRPASAMPYSVCRSRGLAPYKQQQQEYLDAKLASTRLLAMPGSQQQQQQQQQQQELSGREGGRGIWEVAAEQGVPRKLPKPRPMSAGPTAYGGGLPGAMPHDTHTRSSSNQGTPARPLSRPSSSLHVRPQSAVPLSPMGRRDGGGAGGQGGGAGQASSPPAVGGISGHWGGPVGAGYSIASAYPTALRPSSAQGGTPAEGRQLRWAS